MKNLENAKKILKDGNFTCVLCKDGTTYTTTERGVKPLVRWLTEETNLQGFSAADKVVGKATAYLYCLLGVKSVYAPVISTAALEVLRRHGIHTEFDLEADFIWNRRKTGPCPMESAVREISDPREAYAAILQTLAAIGGDGHGIAFLLQIHLQQLRDILVVFHDQNRYSHILSSSVFR